MAEQLVQQSFNPRICVLNPPEVDEFVKNMQHESLLSLLQYAPSPQEITVRNTRKMSFKPEGFRAEFVPLAENIVFPGIEDANSSLRQILESQQEVYPAWLKSILEQTIRVVSPFETWSHPVAGILAVNASDSDPLETFDKLIEESYERLVSLPFVNAEFLRYFVLVHDEGSDYNETLAVFERVKQKFGPHSAILRLGSSQDQQNTDNTLALIRNLMMQSVVPFMEECCDFWYEQVAASKQGFAGRLLSVGRRYLTNSSKININVLENISRKTQRRLVSPFTQQPLKTNYNVDGSYYHWSAPPAQLRKIADFAVMLRDYRFANGIYEMLRKENTSEKAWRYAAASQEMSCATLLLSHQMPLARDSPIDTMLDSSFYTYISRCQLPLWALRSIFTVTELLSTLPIDQGVPALHSYATVWGIKWLTKILSEQLATPLLYPIICERIAHAYKVFNRGGGNGSRQRKESFWLLLAANEWSQQGFPKEFSRCFEQSRQTYLDKPYAEEPLFRRLAEKFETST